LLERKRGFSKVSSHPVLPIQKKKTVRRETKKRKKLQSILEKSRSKQILSPSKIQKNRNLELIVMINIFQLLTFLKKKRRKKKRKL
jgi:hypothetical protein